MREKIFRICICTFRASQTVGLGSKEGAIENVLILRKICGNIKTFSIKFSDKLLLNFKENLRKFKENLREILKILYKIFRKIRKNI